MYRFWMDTLELAVHLLWQASPEINHSVGTPFYLHQRQCMFRTFTKLTFDTSMHKQGRALEYWNVMLLCRSWGFTWNTCETEKGSAKQWQSLLKNSKETLACGFLPFCVFLHLYRWRCVYDRAWGYNPYLKEHQTLSLLSLFWLYPKYNSAFQLQW